MSKPEADAWTTAGIWVVGATAAAVSWTGWFLLAEMCGWNRDLAALLPLAVDVYVITSARVWLKLPWVSPETRKYAAASTFLAVGFSIAANAAYHLMASLGWSRAPWPVVVVVSGLAPLMLALVAHLQARLNADRAASVSVPSVAPRQEAIRQPEPEAISEPQAPAIEAPPEDAMQEPAGEPSGTPAGAPSPAPRERAPRLADDPDATAARAAYRKSVRARKPLSDRALGELYGRGRTWGANRIAEVKGGPKLARAQ